MNNIIEQAKSFATQKFNEVEKDNHFLEVFGILKDDFNVVYENVLIAGLLHDTFRRHKYNI